MLKREKIDISMETTMQNVKCKEVSAEYLKSIGYHFENGTLERAEVTDINGVATVNAVIKLSSGGYCSLGGYGCGQYNPQYKSIKGSRFGFESLLWLMAIAGVSSSAELGGQFVRVALDSSDRASFIGHIVEDRWFCFATLCKELGKE